jgi:Double zinc ribbon
MVPFAYFGIESGGLNLVVDLLIVFVVVLYFALAYWTYADARRRLLDPMLIGCATAAALLFPFVGAVVYVIVRPPEYLEDVRERELEMQAAEARVRELEGTTCPHCDYRIERDFLRCPSCLRKLKERCTNCNRPLDEAWTICPYCEADVPPRAAPRRAPRRRRAAPLAGDRADFGAPATAGGRLVDQETRSERAPLAGGGSEIDGDEDEASPAIAESEPVARPATPPRPARSSSRARPEA